MSAALRACSTACISHHAPRTYSCPSVFPLAPTTHCVPGRIFLPRCSKTQRNIMMHAQVRRDPELSMSEVTVDEIMVPHPICFHVDQTVKEAARMMIEKNISGGPVIDDAGHLVGVLTEDDLMWKGAGMPLDHFLVPPIFIGAFDLYFFLKDNAAVEQELRKILANKVGDAMTKETVSVTGDASMSEASKVMLKHRIHSLPVVDEGKVVGVITRHDVLRALIASHSPLLE